VSVTAGAVTKAPLASNSHVYLGSRDRHLYALDIGSGEQQWRFETGRQINAAPAVVGGTVYVADFSNELFALTTDGELRWRTETSGNISGAPAVAGGRIFLGSENNGLYALESGGDLEFVSGTRSGETVTGSPLSNPDSGPLAFLVLPVAAVALLGLLAGALYLLFNSELTDRFSVDEAPVKKLYEDEEEEPEMPGFGERNETAVWSVIVNDVIGRAEHRETVAQRNIIVTKHIDDALESPVTAYEIESARDEPAQVTIDEQLPGGDGREALDDQPLNEGWRLGETLSFEATVEAGETVRTMVGRPDVSDDDFAALLGRPAVTIEVSDDETTAVSDGSGEESG